MNRDAAYTYLVSQFSSAFADAGVDYNDPLVLDPVIDDALLMIGVAASDLPTYVVDDADVYGYRKVLRYAGLESIYYAIMHRTDVTISDPNVSKRRSQAVDNILKALDRARAEADIYLVGESIFQTGSITFGPVTCPEGIGVW